MANGRIRFGEPVEGGSICSTRSALPPDPRSARCLAGLRAAGFAAASIEVTQVYGIEGLLGSELARAANDGRIVSGFVRATKPV